MGFFSRKYEELFLAEVRKLNHNLTNTNMKLSEIGTILTQADAHLTEAGTELVAELQKLRDQIGDPNISPEVEATLNSLAAKAKGLADIIPNEPQP